MNVPASKIKKGQKIVFRVSNGSTIGRVFKVAEEPNPITNGPPLICLYLHLARPVLVPAMTGRKSDLWPLIVAPDDPVELYV